MMIINTKCEGTNAYDITINKTAVCRVFACTLEDALDIVADHIERQGFDNLYIEHGTFETMAECSKWQTPEAFAKANNLVRCGTNGIYIEITNVKGCPNG